MKPITPERYIIRCLTFTQSLKTYLYFSGFSLNLDSESGVMAIATNMGTLYLAMMSMAARNTSERSGPTTTALTFFSRMVFSKARRASVTGTPGSASRVSLGIAFRSRFSPPTITPPWALISSTAI